MNTKERKREKEGERKREKGDGSRCVSNSAEKIETIRGAVGEEKEGHVGRR